MKPISHLRIALLLAAIGLSDVYAQKTWTLQDCIDYAVENNIQIQKNRIAEEKGEVALWKNRGALLPSLSFSTNHDVGYRPGPSPRP